MKTKHLTFLVIFLISTWSCRKSGDIGTTDYTQLLQHSIDTTWQNFTNPLPNFKGGLGIYIVCPKGSYFVSSGLDQGASASSHFRAASITKSFTSAAIMLLDQQGKLSIEDIVTKLIPGTTIPYLPDDASYQIPYKGQITIRQLLEHRANIFDQVNSVIPDTVNAWYAGLTYYLSVITTKERYHQFTLDEMHLLISKHQLTYGPPGIEHHYSNNGYTLLAKIIERVSGKSYHDFVRDEILAKNHLNETTLPYLGRDTAMVAPFLRGYFYLNGTTIDFSMFNMSWGIAEGNLITTFRDLASFYKNLLTGNAGLNSRQVSRMTQCLTSNDSYGLGIEFKEGLGYGHTGSHYGYLTVAFYDPLTDVMVISESTLYPGDPVLDATEGKAVVNLIKQMKKTLGY
ncbi:MAG: beta-lactamase family protein [Prolixibacteraceae bacterium]|jgi:D-alanyl-D-alanine carboxypeptidase|nr:beta-lactamase family protein [Prolixibacteraceae bacterium]